MVRAHIHETVNLVSEQMRVLAIVTAIEVITAADAISMSTNERMCMTHFRD